MSNTVERIAGLGVVAVRCDTVATSSSCKSSEESIAILFLYLNLASSFLTTKHLRIWTELLSSCEKILLMNGICVSHSQFESKGESISLRLIIG